MQTVPNLIQPVSAPVVSQITKSKRQLRASSPNLAHIQQNMDMNIPHVQPVIGRNNAQQPVKVTNSKHVPAQQAWDIHNQMGQHNGYMYPQPPVRANEIYNTGNVQLPTTQTPWPQHVPQQTTTELEESTDDSSSDDDEDLNQLGSRHIQIINSTGMPAEGINLKPPSISIC